MKFNYRKYLPLIYEALIAGLNEALRLEEKESGPKVRDMINDRYYWPQTIVTDIIDIATGLYSSKEDDDYVIEEGGD